VGGGGGGGGGRGGGGGGVWARKFRGSQRGALAIVPLASRVATERRPRSVVKIDAAPASGRAELAGTGLPKFVLAPNTARIPTEDVEPVADQILQVGPRCATAAISERPGAPGLKKK